MMKEITYQKEAMFLSPYAKKSCETEGRERPEPDCELRTAFQRDRDRIIHAKSFRRLKNKTQVFVSPEGDHYRTRLTHTLDVTQIARTLCRALSLNEDLGEAIALGHDLGHTPFGHSGERTLARISGHFEHNEQSLRVVEVLENDGAGLNLTKEVRDGILHHKKSGTPMTLEGKAVSLADRIAYLNHDIDDSIRAGILHERDLPESVAKLGGSSRERINAMVFSVYNESNGKSFVKMGEAEDKATEVLRDFMFEKVYFHSSAMKEEEKADAMLEILYHHFEQRPEKLPPFYCGLLEKYSKAQVLCDYLSSMSDRYAVYVFESLYVPASWSIQS